MFILKMTTKPLLNIVREQSDFMFDFCKQAMATPVGTETEIELK